MNIKIYVVGNKENYFLSLDLIRKKYFIDEFHSGDNIDKLNLWTISIF